jgi:hypothetical protein
MIDSSKVTWLASFAGFQIGWFACVLGAAYGYWTLGPVAVGLMMLFQLLVVSNAAAEMRPILAALILGYLFDSSLIQMGLFSLKANVLPSWSTSPWMVAMWVNFALTLRHSMSWLRGRYLLGAGMGAFAGPLAYFAGAKLGAMEILTDPLTFSLALGTAWAAAVPLLIWVSWGGEK